MSLLLLRAVRPPALRIHLSYANLANKIQPRDNAADKDMHCADFGKPTHSGKPDPAIFNDIFIGKTKKVAEKFAGSKKVRTFASSKRQESRRH